MFQLMDKPQTLFEIIADSLRLYRKSFWKLLPFTIVIACLSIGADALFFFNNIPLTLNQKYYVSAGIFLFELFWFAVMIYQCGQIMYDGNSGYLRSLWAALKKYPICLIQGLLFSIVITIGAIFLIFPGIIFYILFAFGLPLIMLDHKGIISAFVDSARLVWGNWWRTFALFLFFMIIFRFIMVLIQNLFKIPLLFKWSMINTLSVVPIWTYVILGLSIIVILPLFLSLWMCQYHDLKIRYREFFSDRKLVKTLKYR